MAASKLLLHQDHSYILLYLHLFCLISGNIFFDACQPTDYSVKIFLPMKQQNQSIL